MKKIRLTAAQAVVRYLIAQQTIYEGKQQPLFAGIFAIFGHGNVAGLGEALATVREQLPTFRAHNEQAMAHAAIAFAKATQRRRMMACTTSIGPGATNMVTAAALAHVNRLPLLLLPGDSFANRRPDPVLQQVENPTDPTITANDCFRPVSRYWDRICRPEQLLASLPNALRVLTDPVECGPVTLALPQDVQAEAYDFPVDFFEPVVRRMPAAPPEPEQVTLVAERLRRAERPLLIAGGGVHYAGASQVLADFALRHKVPVVETQAGKGALAWDHPFALGALGVTGSPAANELVECADLVLAVGTRLSDFTTASRSLFNQKAGLVGLNVGSFDAHKHGALPLVADAARGLRALSKELGDVSAPADWCERAQRVAADWHVQVDRLTAPVDRTLPTDAQVVGEVNRFAPKNSVVVCAAGGLPAELHKLWRCVDEHGYHVEYGYSCMGYEIAGGIGVKLARPEREVFVLVGDGSYLMLNSEIATSVMLGTKLNIVVLDNRGFGCIDRLQRSCGSESFNNLLSHVQAGPDGAPRVDFAAHAAALGAYSEKVSGVGELPPALARASEQVRTAVIVIETDPASVSAAGGVFWDVPVAEVSGAEGVQKARKRYEQGLDAVRSR